MFINGRDPEHDGWIPIQLSGWRAGMAVSRAVTAIPNVGGVSPSTVQQAAPREIKMGFRRRLSALGDRDAALSTLATLLSGQLFVRFDDSPDRLVQCYAAPIRVDAVHEIAVFATPTFEVSVVLVCYDGASYDVEPRVVALTTTPVDIPLGTLPSTFFLLWGGAWSAGASRTLTLRDAAGTVRSTMTFTAPSIAAGDPADESLGSSDVLEVDISRRYVTKLASSVRTNQYDWYASGGWIGLDPAYQDLENSRYASLEASAGTAQIIYRRAYAL